MGSHTRANLLTGEKGIMSQPLELDEKLLGERVSGTPEQRKLLLEDLQDMVNRNGPKWVRRHKDIILAMWKHMVEDL